MPQDHPISEGPAALLHLSPEKTILSIPEGPAFKGVEEPCDQTQEKAELFPEFGEVESQHEFGGGAGFILTSLN